MKQLLIVMAATGLLACGESESGTKTTHTPQDNIVDTQPDQPDSSKPNESDTDFHSGISARSYVAEKMKKADFYFSDSLINNKELSTLTEADYQTKINTMVNSDGFVDHIKRSFEDLLMTNKYIAKNMRDGAINLYSQNDFPNRKWYDAQFEDQNTIRNCVRDMTNDALANAPLELISHTVKSNLPLSTILTADYMMVNYYSQQSLGATLVGGGDFKKLAEPVCVQTSNGEVINSIAYDPSDFKAARIEHSVQRFDGDITHAGILSDAVFLNRYPTTDTNINRHRARIVMEYFLDFDILSIDKDRTVDVNDSVNAIPTLENPNCTICHNMLDPIASSFRNYNATGRIIPVELKRGDNAWNINEILPPGLLGKDAPQEIIERSQLLAWLGNELVKDVRFPRAMVKVIYRGLYGELPDKTLLTDADYASFESLLNQAITEFTANNFDVKAAARTLIADDQWANVQAKTAASNIKRRLVTPEIMKKKLQLLTNTQWQDLDVKSRNLMFGGVDGDTVTERMTDPNGIFQKMQNRMAVEVACESVANDFALPANERRLFPLVGIDAVPSNSEGITDPIAMIAIKKNMQYLHAYLLNESIDLNDDELAETYDLFTRIRDKGLMRLQNQEQMIPKPLSGIHSACHVRSNSPALTNMIGESSTAKSLHTLANTNNCLNSDGDNVNVAVCDDSNAQNWVTKSNQVKWANDQSLCLSADAISNGKNVYLEKCDVSKVTQNWQVVGGQLRHDNFSLDVSRNNVIVYSSHGGSNQTWSVSGSDPRTEIHSDEDYTVRAWMAVVTYLLSDALFIFE